MTLWSSAALLFFVLDPFGNVPKVLIALKNMDRRRRDRILVRELLIALGVILTFLFVGEHLLRIMHVTEQSLTIGGGVILFLIALRMVFPGSGAPIQEEGEEPFIVPLAVPYFAGPATIATVIFLGSGEPERRPVWVAAVFLAWLGAGLVILAGNRLASVLGKRGLAATERLMGMVLVAISVEMLMRGVSAFLAAQGGAAARGG